MKMNFDIVIPTMNRPEDLERLIDSISRSTELPQKVIIIDQSKNTPKFITSELFEVHHINTTDVSGLTAAKNKGVQYCNSDIIHFFDDDIIVDPDYFETIHKHFIENPQYVGICGRQKNSKSSRMKLLAFSFFHIGAFSDIRKKCNSGYVKKSLVDTNILPGGITAYKKSVFDEFSFDETLVKYCLGEDMDFSYRVSKKYKLAFATDALALHNHSAIGRYDAKEAFACKVAGYSYFYEKNMSKRIFDKFAYSLVILGIIADSLAYTCSKMDLTAIKGVSKGFHYIRNKYSGVPFLDVNKIQL